jgi:hypothetical protein
MSDKTDPTTSMGWLMIQTPLYSASECPLTSLAYNVIPSLSAINFHSPPATEIVGKTINIKMIIMRLTVLLI